MNLTPRVFTIACLLVPVLAAGPALRAATLANPGFETGDLSGWSTFGDGWRIGTVGDANSGTYGAVNDIQDDSGFKGIFQEVDVTPGTFYNAGVFLRAVAMEDNAVESWLEVQWLDSGSGVIRQDQSTPRVIGEQLTYQRQTLTMMEAPAGAVQASVRGIIEITSLQSSPDIDFVTFDDFEFGRNVPEPTTMAMLGMAAISLVALRRVTVSRPPA